MEGEIKLIKLSKYYVLFVENMLIYQNIKENDK